MQELVSIITPAYNSGRFIGMAIESVQNQTYSFWEMLIADDGSVDETKDIVDQYAQNDGRIVWIPSEKNTGAAGARNRAIKLAKGRYFAFLDSDDQWKKNKLEKQLNFMKVSDIAFSFTAYEILVPDGTKLVSVPEKVNYAQYMKDTIIGCLTVMIDTSLINEVQFVEIKRDHDSMTWARLLRQVDYAYGLNESLSYYRRVKGSISNNKLRAVKNHWVNCRTIEKVPFFKCCYYFMFYIVHAVKKHYF